MKTNGCIDWLTFIYPLVFLNHLIPFAASMPSRPLPIFWRVFYNLIAVPLMFCGFQAAAFFCRFGFTRFDKIRSGVVGRKKLFDELTAQIAQVKNSAPRFWIHASSMGEYEQARPLLQEIKQRLPEAVRVLTLFSPSVYANINRANIPAEVISYLSFDSLWNARRFLNLVNPAAAIIIRHDFWPNHLWEAKQRGVALLLADASVSANARSLRHWPLVRHFNRAVFDTFDAICAVSPEAAKSLANLVRHPERLLVTGDSRYDQVLFRTQSRKIDDLLPANWRGNSPIFVAGSTWLSDEEVLLPAFVAVRKHLPQLRMIVVPHEPAPEHLAQLEKKISGSGLVSVRFSQLMNEKEGGTIPSILLIDRIGILAILYSAGQVAFVGGSFGPGVHSVLEAAVHGVPVLVGPRFRNSPEAVELDEKKFLTVVGTAEQCQKELLELFQNAELRREKGRQHREFVLGRCGASAKMIDILTRLSATNFR
jgi:3-deoxy-D-manno-octulosonic-acid transferase